MWALDEQETKRADPVPAGGVQAVVVEDRVGIELRVAEEDDQK